MSIPGKILIALLCSFAVSALAAALLEGHSLTTLLAPTAAAALAAVILSHRALPMPGSMSNAAAKPATRADRSAASPSAGDARKPAAPKPARKTTQAATAASASPAKKKPAAKAAATAPAGADNASGPVESGTVKWFNGSKGFGFIIRDNGEEIFVHHRSIRGEGRRSLRDGAPVNFRVVTTDKGPQAEDVEATD